MQLLDLCRDDYRDVEKERLPAQATSFYFLRRGGKSIAYFNHFLRVLKTFLMYRRRLSARKSEVTPREKRVISLAACVVPGSVCTSAFYIDKNEDEQERVSLRWTRENGGMLVERGW